VRCGVKIGAILPREIFAIARRSRLRSVRDTGETMNVNTHLLPKAAIATAIVGLGLVHVLVRGDWPSVIMAIREVATASATWIGGSVTAPLWLLGILCAVAMIAIGAGLSLWWKSRRKIEPDTARLTTAVVFGIRWRWSYREGEMCDLVSFCPKCDLQVLPKTESRHGFLHLISYSCVCRKWRSRSFQCSQANFVERVCRAIEQDVRKGHGRVSTAQHA
jgi:hypothetical protein